MANAEIRVKVCGIPREEHLRGALDMGVDFIGINLWPQSPRSVDLDTATKLSRLIPEGKRVMVDVATDAEKLKSYEPYFDYFQIHFPFDTDIENINSWLNTCSRERLWLAPKLPPGQDYPDAIINSVDTLLADTYTKEGFGGSGQTGNWEHFARLRERYPDKTWILAGGLTPENISDAIRESKTAFVDVNSGVETAPGLKCMSKLEDLMKKISEGR